MILQWAKVVTVTPLTINSQDKSDEDYRPRPQDKEEGYGTANAQQDRGGAQHRDGIRARREALMLGDTRQDRRACVGRMRTAVKTWPPDEKECYLTIFAPEGCLSSFMF
jgi:hypothetical protein